MKKILFALLFLPALSLLAQSSNCSFTMECKIIAPSGMRMRAAPNLKASVVTYVPFDSALVACTEIFGKMTYEKIEGNWRKVKYQGKQGFMFDGFMEITKVQPQTAEQTTEPDDSVSIPIFTEEVVDTKPKANPIAPNTNSTVFNFMTEAYNYCGDVSKIDPGLLWYGFYPKDESASSQNYRVMQVDVEVVLSKQKVGDGLEFDITTKNQERSIFLLGLNRPLEFNNLSITDQSERYRYGGRKVYPGQVITIGTGKNKMTLAASGSVEGAEPCPILKDYALTLKGSKYFLDVEQNLSKMLSGSGTCGMPEIYWYGDFTGDGVAEIIVVSVYEDKNQFTLFISNPNRDDVLLEKKAEWTVDKCY